MWHIEYEPTEHTLTIRLTQTMFVSDMNALARAHAKALEATGGEEFRMLVDLRGLRPLDAATAAVLADMKRVAVQLPSYLGRAVLVDSATVAMQQHNATLEDGGDESELITNDAAAAMRFVQAL